MSAQAYTALAPYIVLTGGLMVLLLVTAFVRSHVLTLVVAVASLLASLASIPTAMSVGPQTISDFMTIDGYAHFFNALFVLAAVATALVSHRYLADRVRSAEEFYILLVTSTLGAMAMTGAAHFASFILGLEILSISLYAMIAYPERGTAPLEAAAKYLILSGVASTTILFGMALVYAGVGSMLFVDVLTAGGLTDSTNSVYYSIGQAMILVGLAFKLSLVPFHMWTPDVYQGAPAPVTGFVATISKGAVFAMLLRYAVQTDLLSNTAIVTALGLIAVVSMVVGNLLALLQDNIKRILAYSSIAHVGYLLIALLLVSAADDPRMALETTMMYLTGYFLMTLSAFGVVTVLSTSQDEDAGQMSMYEGLFWRRPVVAAVLTTAALSLAGIPLTVGFIAKFYLFAAGIEGALWGLIWALIIGSAIGVYYYLRIVFTMTKTADDSQPQPVHASPSWEGMLTVVVLGVSLVVFGVYPTPLIDLVRRLIGTFGA